MTAEVEAGPEPSRLVADALLDLLNAWGVRHLFTCPGSTEAAVLDALVDRTDIEVVLTTNESIAVSMADGLARVTGQPAVAYLHANVGLTNGLAHLYAAQIGHSPVVVLNGLKPSIIQSRSGFTTSRRTRDLVAQYVKDDWQSLAPDQVVEDVHRAFVRAVAEPAGPTWVGLSQDLVEATTTATTPDVVRSRPDTRATPSPTALPAAAELLQSARRPVLVAGSEVARQHGLAALTALSERLGAAVLLEERRGLERAGFATVHTHYRGHYEPSHPVVAQADALFFVGCRLFHEFEPATRAMMPPAVPVVHSHTDAAEIGRIHPVTVGLVGNQRLTLEALLALLPDDARTPLPAGPAAVPPPVGTRVAPGVFRPVDAVRVLTESLRGSIIVGDATTAGGLLARHVEIHQEDDYFVSTSGSLGWGVGAALGIALGRPDRHVAAVLGDGVFQFGVPGLWTAARHGIPVTFVVLNNQRYAAVGAALRRYGGRAAAVGRWPGTDISGPDICAISTGFGVPAHRVADLDELRERLVGHATSGPELIEVMTDPDDFGP